MGAASGLQRGTEGMPEMQKPVLEHAAPKANQNQRLDGHLANEAATSMQITVETCADVSPRVKELQILLPVLTIMNQVTLQALRSLGFEEGPLRSSAFESTSGRILNHSAVAGE